VVALSRTWTILSWFQDKTLTASVGLRSSNLEM
jgi:hypothetical protein